MNANDVIDSYVTDVARRLPRKQRNDVGFELRALLNEELAGKAEAAGRPADDAMAMTLVREFGRPDEVADRYRPPGFTIIKPSDSRAFITMALGGVLLQWGITLPAVLFPNNDVSAGSASDGLLRLGHWWTSWGLGAFWWPGFLVTIAILAGWMRHRWPLSAAEWRPATYDRDHVNRPLMVFAVLGALIGISVMVFLPQFVEHLVPGKAGPVVARVLAYDDTFFSQRGPWLLPVWMAQLVLLAVVTAEGRWREFTRRLEIAFGAVMALVLAWFLAAGPIWHLEQTDKTAKALIALIIVVIVIDIAVKLRRELMRLRPPAVSVV